MEAVIPKRLLHGLRKPLMEEMQPHSIPAANFTAMVNMQSGI